MTSPPFEAHGVRYRVDPAVYDPSDDSWLLLDAVRRVPPGRLLELGTGSGVVAIGAALAGHTVVATDVNPRAVSLARANARLNGASAAFVRADLARGLRLGAFDLVAFNPPYLPTGTGDHVPGPLDAALDGGPDGLRVVRRLLDAAGEVPLLLVASTLQAGWPRLAAAHGLHVEVLASVPLPHERLDAVRVTRKG